MNTTTLTTLTKTQCWDMLGHFMSNAERRSILIGLAGEEREYFAAKIKEMAERIHAMPGTGQTDALGDQAIVQLHYFKGGMDWFIIEKDARSPDDEVPGQQHQAFGLACLGGDELGYISIHELIQNDVELDLYWTPRTLAEVLAERAA